MSKLLIIIFIFALLLCGMILLHKTSSGQKRMIAIKEVQEGIKNAKPIEYQNQGFGGGSIGSSGVGS